MNLLDKLDLDLAWARVKNDSKTDFILSSYLFQIYERHLEENLKKLREKIAQGYRVSELWDIDVPKPHFVLRPGSVPKIEDRIYFQALVDVIAPEVEKKIIPTTDKVIFSHRLSEKPNDSFMFRQSLWNEFEQKVRDNYAAKKTVLVVTDIVGFFEHIDLNILKDMLIRFSCDREISDSIYEVLKSWKRRTNINRGIPQGLWPTDFLGNIYLDSVDKYMLRHGFDYFRYVDDIRISCSTIPEARRALKTLVEELRRLNLNVQTKKTAVYYDGKVKSFIDELSLRMEEITNEVKEALKEEIADEITSETPYVELPYGGTIRIEFSDIEDEVEAKLEEKKELIEIESLRKFYEDTIKNAFPSSKHLRFCLNRLSQLKDDIALDRALTLLQDMPFESNTIISYLKNFPDNEKIRDRIIRFLKSDFNIYDWQEMWLLEYLFSCKCLQGDEIDYLWTVIENHNRHNAVRIRAILLLGRTGLSDHLERLRDLYDIERDEYVRVSIIVSLREYDKGPRNYFYNLCKGHSAFIDQAISYMKEISK
ncbi:MAG: reverse transcriptase domain-containing protein [Thermodesulfovibrionales bacterium]